MANKLKDLVVKEISFCKQGAVAGAKISVYKSADPKEQPEESLIQKVMDRISKAFKLDPITQETEEVQKGVFADAWTSREIKNNFYDAFWTLDNVVWGIMNDELITDKVSQIQSAVREFADLIPTILPVDTTSVTKMAEVHKSIGEFVTTLEKVEFEKGGQEDMTPEERAALVAEVTKSITDSLTGVIKTAVTEEVKPLQEQLTKQAAEVEAIGKAVPAPQNLAPDAKDVKKTAEDNFWAGAL